MLSNKFYLLVKKQTSFICAVLFYHNASEFDWELIVTNNIVSLRLVPTHAEKIPSTT